MQSDCKRNRANPVKNGIFWSDWKTARIDWNASGCLLHRVKQVKRHSPEPFCHKSTKTGPQKNMERYILLFLPEMSIFVLELCKPAITIVRLARSHNCSFARKTLFLDLSEQDLHKGSMKVLELCHYITQALRSGSLDFCYTRDADSFELHRWFGFLWHSQLGLFMGRNILIEVWELNTIWMHKQSSAKPYMWVEIISEMSSCDIHSGQSLFDNSMLTGLCIDLHCWGDEHASMDGTPGLTWTSESVFSRKYIPNIGEVSEREMPICTMS